MSTELNHILIPARSRWASAAFLASNLDVPDHHHAADPRARLARLGHRTVTVRERPHRHPPAPMRDVGALLEARASHGGRGGLPDGRLADAIAHVALGIFIRYFAKAARACTGWSLVNQPIIH